MRISLAPLTLCLVFVLLRSGGLRADDAPPNFVIIFADDQGYGDLGCFGAKKIKTPNIDKMAREGMRFTDFYSQVVCGPARTALLTGCYPIRVAEFGNDKRKFPYVHSKEILLPRVLQAAGYRTGMIGKVDITQRKRGWRAELNPVRRGFDFWYGVVGANDFGRVSLLHRNEKVLAQSVASLDNLLQDYTKEALGFIRENRDKPFLLYFAHTMPHVLLATSEEFRGKSAGGLYGDVIEEMDWSAGQIIELLKELKLDKNTIVVYTSDNGPWDNHARLNDKTRAAGSAGPLRGSKGATWEGGIREPCVVWGPGFVPAGTTCKDVCSTMDLLPTFIEMAGAKLPEDRIIDGKSIADLMQGKPAGGERPFYYYSYSHLQAVRLGKWKLVPPRLPDCENPVVQVHSRYFLPETMPAVKELHLFDLEKDLGESRNVAKDHPEVVARLEKLMEAAREDLGDYRGPGKGVRFFDEGPRWKTVETLRKKRELKLSKQPSGEATE